MIRSIEGEMVEQKVNNDLLYRSFSIGEGGGGWGLVGEEQ
jgi:hypothetical protein